jgi:hypothetical protein
MSVNNEWITDPKYLRNESKGVEGFGTYHKIPGTRDDERGYFAFIRSVYDYNFQPEMVEDELILTVATPRCDARIDAEIPKPTALHETDMETGLCKLCGSDAYVYPTTHSHVASLNNTRILRMPIQGHKGFIVYLRLNSKELEESDFNYSENLGKTLQELFRLMLEWQWCYLELDTRDTYSTLAHEILEELELPESIRQWLWNEVPDQRVAKFLKGDTNARVRSDTSTIPDMSLEFDSWCWYNIVDKPALWTHGSR